MAIVEVVKYNGGPDVFACKHPFEEFGTWTQLIVNESQEAILFKGGKALDVFSSGRHTLDTANIPLLNHIINLPFGGRSPFTAEIWFVNKAYSLDIKWGTPSPVQIQDPKYGVFVPVRSNGVFGVRIDDSKRFLVKLVGTLPVFDQVNLVKYFRGLYVTKVKDSISSYLIHKQISVLEINAYIDELSSYLKERIEPTLREYGISLVSFYVNDISVPENDPAVQQLKSALAKRAEMDILGYSYAQERSFDTLEGAAKNTGSVAAPLVGAGMGLGMGFGVAGSVGAGFGGMARELDIGGHPAKECPKCRASAGADQRFCGVCGYNFSQGDGEESAKYICGDCGAAFAKGARFCPECGRVIDPCPHCGRDLPEGVEFCPVCGHAVPQKCPKCGSMIPVEAKFCPECGESLAKRCGNCGASIQGSPKFCPECGEKL